MTHSLDNLPPFDAIVAVLVAAEEGSFWSPAERLSLTHGSVSRRLAQLEHWAGRADLRPATPRRRRYSGGSALPRRRREACAQVCSAGFGFLVGNDVRRNCKNAFEKRFEMTPASVRSLSALADQNVPERRGREGADEIGSCLDRDPPLALCGGPAAPPQRCTPPACRPVDPPRQLSGDRL
ncbi:LysR family transcriptional regulator [Sphingopyxis sp. JAI128]|uniref:helix-turn-helix domain-containing protein n=1 Tax=Sphingopyxis sp. JAI128 TaxID=2723066 RepID=UPI00390CC271